MQEDTWASSKCKVWERCMCASVPSRVFWMYEGQTVLYFYATHFVFSLCWDRFCYKGLCHSANNCHESSQFTRVVAFQVTWVVLSFLPSESWSWSKNLLMLVRGKWADRGYEHRLWPEDRFIYLVGLSLSVNCILVLLKPGPWRTERADTFTHNGSTY